MQLDKLFSEIRSKAMEKEMSDVAENVISLYKSKNKILNLIIQTKKCVLAEEIKTNLDDLIVNLSQILLDDNRPTDEELKQIIK